jgi:hypothetical protein
MTNLYMCEVGREAWRVYKRGFIWDSNMGTYDYHGAVARMKELADYYRPSHAIIYNRDWSERYSWSCGPNPRVLK